MKTMLALALSFMALSATPAKADHIPLYRAQQIVRVLYQGALFREPDPSGMATWTRVLVTQGSAGLTEVAYGIGNSDEFRTRIAPPNYTASVILSNIYQSIFSRDIDPAAFQTWLPMINQGRAGEVLYGIVHSSEFFDLYL